MEQNPGGKTVTTRASRMIERGSCLKTEEVGGRGARMGLFDKHNLDTTRRNASVWAIGGGIVGELVGFVSRLCSDMPFGAFFSRSVDGCLLLAQRLSHRVVDSPGAWSVTQRN